MRKAISMVLLSAFVFISFAPESEGAEALSYDMYRIENVVIKFKPPKDWKMREGTIPSIHLNFRPQGDEASLASLGIAACSAPFAAGFNVEKLMKATDADASILNKEIVGFAGTRAFSSISEMGTLKTKTIQFLKDDNMFTITFVADSKDFDALLPKVDESLKTFKVVMPGLTPVLGETIAQDHPMAPAVPALAQIPVPLIAEPFQEAAQANSVVMIGLKSGTTVKGKVLERLDNRLKVDFHGVPISVYFSDINTIDEIEPAVN